MVSSIKESKSFLSLNTQIPPCAKNESLFSASDFVNIRTFLSLGTCKAANNPLAPVPTITISASNFSILFCQLQHSI